MITCKYCGTELQFLGQKEEGTFFNCSHCDMVFPLADTSVDRKRRMSIPDYLEINVYQSTKELLESDTLTLYHILKEVRTFWFQIKGLLESAKVFYKENELPQPVVGETSTISNVKDEFKLLTKQKFVIENILLERTGFFPDKLTKDFLEAIEHHGVTASEKPMYIYIK